MYIYIYIYMYICVGICRYLSLSRDRETEGRRHLKKAAGGQFSKAHRGKMGPAPGRFELSQGNLK